MDQNELAQLLATKVCERLSPGLRTALDLQDRHKQQLISEIFRNWAGGIIDDNDSVVNTAFENLGSELAKLIH